MAQPLTQYQELSCRLGLDQSLLERFVEASSCSGFGSYDVQEHGSHNATPGLIQEHAQDALDQRKCILDLQHRRSFRAKHDHIEATIMKHLQRHVFSVSRDS